MTAKQNVTSFGSMTDEEIITWVGQFGGTELETTLSKRLAAALDAIDLLHKEGEEDTSRYDAGYEQGLDDGYEDGYNSGFDAGVKNES